MKSYQSTGGGGMHDGDMPNAGSNVEGKLGGDSSCALGSNRGNQHRFARA